jgi:hypothetical protein
LHICTRASWTAPSCTFPLSYHAVNSPEHPLQADVTSHLRLVISIALHHPASAALGLVDFGLRRHLLQAHVVARHSGDLEVHHPEMAGPLARCRGAEARIGGGVVRLVTVQEVAHGRRQGGIGGETVRLAGGDEEAQAIARTIRTREVGVGVERGMAAGGDKGSPWDSAIEMDGHVEWIPSASLDRVVINAVATSSIPLMPIPTPCKIG